MLRSHCKPISTDANAERRIRHPEGVPLLAISATMLVTFVMLATSSWTIFPLLAEILNPGRGWYFPEIRPAPSQAALASQNLAKDAIHATVRTEMRSYMTIMNISLSDEMKAFVEAQMAADGYASASEYLRALIREDQKRRAKQALEAMLLEGLQGPAVEMTGEDWDSMMQEAAGRHAREQAQT